MDYEAMTHAELDAEMKARRICRREVVADRGTMASLLRMHDELAAQAAARAAYAGGYYRKGTPAEVLPRLLAVDPEVLVQSMPPVWWVYFALDCQRVLRYLGRAAPDEAAVEAAARLHHERNRQHAGGMREVAWDRLLMVQREHKVDAMREQVRDYLAALV